MDESSKNAVEEIRSALEERDAELERTKALADKLGHELKRAEERELHAVQLAADWYGQWQSTHVGRLVFATEQMLQQAEDQGRIRRRGGGSGGA